MAFLGKQLQLFYNSMPSFPLAPDYNVTEPLSVGPIYAPSATGIFGHNPQTRTKMCITSNIDCCWMHGLLKAYSPLVRRHSLVLFFLLVKVSMAAVSAAFD